MSVKLISITPDTEKLIAYMARVSNPANQNNPKIKGLLKYCIREGHWSIFQMCNLVVEIKTTRAISAQILRHRSFSFQEFSQRYSTVEEKSKCFLFRSQDLKNRQNSLENIDEDKKKEMEIEVVKTLNEIDKCYKYLLSNGVAKECARMILPMNSPTTMYMNGTIRSWIHYLKVRTDPSTQKEHRDIALQIKEIFKEQLPIIYEATFL